MLVSPHHKKGAAQRQIELIQFPSKELLQCEMKTKRN